MDTAKPDPFESRASGQGKQPAIARLLLQSLRPAQWTKNGFVLLPLFFARQLFETDAFLRGLAATAVFCTLTGAVYLINDVLDRESDQRHPVKMRRPIAAGMLPPGLGLAAAAVILLVSISAGGFLGLGFLLMTLIYVAIQALYSWRLKQVVLLDIFCISSGFFLRVIAGALAIPVAISLWLIVCTVLISMFLALAKRRHELVLLGAGEAGNHRKVLGRYSSGLLDQMITTIAASTILSYMLYCVSPETVSKFETDYMIATSPFVLFGIFRYMYLIQGERLGGEPEWVVLTDLPLLLDVILWGLSCFLVVYRVF